MILNKNPKGAGGGKNSEESPSNMYCSYCYNEGKFSQPDITAEEMTSFC